VLALELFRRENEAWTTFPTSLLPAPVAALKCDAQASRLASMTLDQGVRSFLERLADMAVAMPERVAAQTMTEVGRIVREEWTRGTRPDPLPAAPPKRRRPRLRLVKGRQGSPAS